MGNTLKSYKNCLTLCRKMIASEQYQSQEKTITRFLKNSKRQVLREGEKYATAHSDNLYNILTKMKREV